MKKNYVYPTVELVKLDAVNMLAASCRVNLASNGADASDDDLQMDGGSSIASSNLWDSEW